MLQVEKMKQLLNNAGGRLFEDIQVKNQLLKVHAETKQKTARIPGHYYNEIPTIHILNEEIAVCFCQCLPWNAFRIRAYVECIAIV